MKLALGMLLAAVSVVAGCASPNETEIAMRLGPARNAVQSAETVESLGVSGESETLSLDWDSLKTSWSVDTEVPWPAVVCLVHASRVSYGSQSQISTQFQLWGFETAFIRRAVDNRLVVFVASTDEYRLIVFVGSDDIRDWLVNLEINRGSATPPPGGKMHRGFRDEFESVRAELTQLLDEDGDKQKPIWLTGHSLGGTLAVACSRVLWAEGFRIDGLVTFGQPLLVNPKLAEKLQHDLGSRYGRFVNGNDIVTRVPPNPPFLKFYRHFGGWVRLRKGVVVLPDAMAIKGAVPEMEDLAPLTEEEFESLKVQLNRQVKMELEGKKAIGIPSFRDHQISNYIKQIELAAGR